MPHDVYGIGNALVDIQVRVSEEDLEELLLPKGGMELTSREEQQRLIDALEGRVDNICSGGSAANTMHGIGALGGQAYYLGRVASDDFGHHYTRDMADCQVGFPGPGDGAAPTGTSLVLITPDAQRTLATHLGISVELHPDNVDPTIVADAKAVYIEGYLWDAEAPRAAARRVAEIANQHGIPVALTLSDAFLIERYREELVEFIQHSVDILFCNEVEGRAMSGAAESIGAFRELSQMVSKLFFTLSERGSWVAHEGEPPISILPFPARKVDTTGAGDLFAAGALYGLTHGYSLEQCGVLGNYCGARIVSQLGARLPQRFDGKVDEIFSSYEKSASA